MSILGDKKVEIKQTIKCNDKYELIIGMTSYDVSYLAELILSKGYEVHGIKRRQSTINTECIAHLRQNPEWRKRFMVDVFCNC